MNILPNHVIISNVINLEMGDLSMEIKSKGYKVIDNGVFLSYAMEPVEFIFNDDFIVRASVINDSGNKGSIDLEIIENKILNVKFINPHTILNFGTMEPFHLGTLNEKEIYANFRINAMGDNRAYTSYSLFYTFFEKEE